MLHLPAAALSEPASAEALLHEAEPVPGGSMLAECTFQYVTQDEEGGAIELARISAAVSIDLERRTFCQRFTQASCCPADACDGELVSVCQSLGLRRQHLAESDNYAPSCSARRRTPRSRNSAKWSRPN